VGQVKETPPGPSIAQISKPKGYGAPAAGAIKYGSIDKHALLERLVRLGATDIPNTPRLLMRRRSPVELRNLQHSVDAGWNKRVTNPIMNVAEKGIGKLPSKAQPVVRKGARFLAEDPVGAVAGNVIPGYSIAKKGLERGIDRFAPMSYPTSLGATKNVGRIYPTSLGAAKGLGQIKAAPSIA
jgi:hypothetical protein